MIIENHRIIGADISFWQGYPPAHPVVDFAKMRRYGFQFVIIKASERNYPDPAFSINWQAAKGILPRGTYHYYRNDFNPITQAGKYWTTIRDDMEGICWLDLEDRNDGSFRGWRNWYDFLEAFKTLSGLSNSRIGIYTAYWYWREEMLHAAWSEREYFRRYPLWLADYGVKGSDPLQPDWGKKAVPTPWHDDECLIVQTGTPVIGLQAGVYSREIDFNFFNGNRELFNKIFKPVPKGLTISIRSA